MNVSHCLPISSEGAACAAGVAYPAVPPSARHPRAFMWDFGIFSTTETHIEFRQGDYECHRLDGPLWFGWGRNPSDVTRISFFSHNPLKLRSFCRLTRASDGWWIGLSRYALSETRVLRVPKKPGRTWDKRLVERPVFGGTLTQT